MPVTAETVFQSGSVGKQFTAALVMLLVQDGKIVLDEKVGTYLGRVPPAWNAITVRHLLTHTAGLSGYQKDLDFRRDYSEDELLARIIETPLEFAPGERWAYSNLGYVTLGILVRKVTGRFYGDLLQERIFKPLGMTTARVISEADIVRNRAAGYVLVRGELKNQEWVSPTLNSTADGSLYLTALDMVRWEAGLKPGVLLQQSSLDAMFAPVKLTSGATHPYGFGWQLATRNGRRVIEHGGAWQGFMSFIARYVDDGLTVVVFANRGAVPVTSIAHGVAALINPDVVEKSVADGSPATTAAHRQLLEDLIAGRTVDRERFTTAMAATVLPRIEESRDALRELGSIQQMELLERAEKAGAAVHRYRVRFAQATARFVVSVDATGKIAGLTLSPE